MEPRLAVRRHSRVLSTAVLAMLALAAFGCARRDEPVPGQRGAPAPTTVQVSADTGRGTRLEVRPPAPADVWLASVTPRRAPSPPPPAPEAPPDTNAWPEAPPMLEVDPGLKPPVLRTPGLLERPVGPVARASVELDVQVTETGRVAAALWAAGARDTALIGAARRCALGMRFYPALRGGEPVAVWCRQRFDFGTAGR